MEPVAGRLLRSAGAAYASQIFRIGVTFVTYLFLRRMIPPEEWGVWAWAEPLFLILAQVRDLGIPGHMVRDDDRPWGSFLRVEAVWGTLFAAVIALAAPVVALAYEDPAIEMAPVVRFMCLFLVAHGLGMVPMVFFEARIEVERTVPAEIARNVVFAVAALGLAALGWSYVSLLAANLAATLTYTAVLWWGAFDRIELRRGSKGFVHLVRVSFPLMVMAVLEQLSLRLDAFVLGLRFRTEVLGFADLAIYAVFFFSRRLADPIGRALYPALVRFKSEPERAFDAFRWATLTLLVVLTPAAFFLFAQAEMVTRILGGKDWAGAAAYLRVLSLVPLMRFLGLFGIEYLLTLHRDRLLILGTLANLVAVGGLGIALVGTELGPLGMAIANYAPVGMLLYAWEIHRHAPRGMRRLLREIAELYGVNALLFLPVAALGDTGWTGFGLGVLAGVLSGTWSLWRYGRGVREFLKDA